MLEKLEGIILKTQDYGETHKIITIFSRKIGKFAAIARGAKKPKSRMAAVTQPFIYGEYLVYINKGLSTVQQGEIIDSVRAVREDIIKTAYASYVMELTDKLMDKLEPDPFIYDQLYLTIQWIAENEDAEIPVMMYELKLYRKGGFAPAVNSCVHCGNRDDIHFSFSIAEGGLLCSTCSHHDSKAVYLPGKTAKLLYLFSEVGLDQVGRISVKNENKQLLRQLIDAYYDHYGGFHLKSRKFLKQLDMLK